MASGNSSGAARTLYDKLWNSHLVRPETQSCPAIMYVDLHMVHEVSSPQAFELLRQRGLPVARPDRTIGVIDHSTPTLPPGKTGERSYVSDMARIQAETLVDNCRRNGIPYHDWLSPDRGIVHVMVPELGLSLPGRTIVCGDSHTSTLGAFGCLAFGIGTTDVAHVLATQSLFQRKAKSMCVEISGRLGKGVSAKDVILAVIARIGTGGGRGYTIEYQGAAVAGMAMEGRMTLCNMTIEAGSRSGLVAPDETTLSWFANCTRPLPSSALERLRDEIRDLRSEDEARFDKTISLEGESISPMLTYGTDPGSGIAIDAAVPSARNADERLALDYMQIEAGKPLIGQPVKTVFLGSCTNSRISDLREAASILRGRKVHAQVHLMVVPGSKQVLRAAAAEGLDKVFIAAGADWRTEPGCSMCIAMNGDTASTQGLTLSTSNRNFPGRQGKGARTILCSPATAAAAAAFGHITDPRTL